MKFEDAVKDIKQEIAIYEETMKSINEADDLPKMFKDHPKWKEDPEMLKIVEDFATMGRTGAMGKLMESKKKLISHRLFLMAFESGEFPKSNRDGSEEFWKIFAEWNVLFVSWYNKYNLKEEFLSHSKTADEREALSMFYDCLVHGAKLIGYDINKVS